MTCYYFDPSLIALWETIRGFLNSSFMSASLSALAGAGLGVWGAQKLAERSSSRKELVDALRQANAIVVLAATIANHALRVKKQHIAPLTAEFFKDRAIAEVVNSRLLQGLPPAGPVNYQANLVKITPVTVPIDSLKQLIYATHTTPGRALAIAVEAEQAVTELTHAINTRTEQVELLKNAQMPEELLWQAYFGLKRRDGNTDSMYHDSMVAIAQYTDDLAFFCAELATELQQHATRLYKKIVKFSPDHPKPSTVDFSGPIKSGLMPDRANYESWLSGFTSPDKKGAV